jgi:hypothetical protein
MLMSLLIGEAAEISSSKRPLQDMTWGQANSTYMFGGGTLLGSGTLRD